MRSKLLAAAIAAAGCSQAPSDPPPAATVNVAAAATVAPAPTPVPVPAPGTTTPPPVATPAATPVAAPVAVTTPRPTPVVAAQPPKPPEPPTVFDYPTDLGGKAVVKAVTPSVEKLPVEKHAAAPKPRVAPARVVDPEPVTRPNTAIPPVLFAKPNEVKPTPPAERVPIDLGALADAVPAKPTFPVAAGIATRARDVSLPPPLPILGRQFNERVSLEDPTAEPGNSAITAPLVKVPVSPAGFVKVAVPDPFELGEQVKPVVPPAAEPGLAPVAVNPQRVK